MFFTLQTVFPTLIFHFQFSILHLIKTVYTILKEKLEKQKTVGLLFS